MSLSKQELFDRIRRDIWQQLCAAIVDRLTFNATLIETGTESFRLARSKAHKSNATK